MVRSLYPDRKDTLMDWYDMNRDDSNDPKTDWDDIFLKVLFSVTGFMVLLGVVFSISIPDFPSIGGFDTTFLLPVGIVAVIMLVIYLRKKARN